ncbi:hypothetical protein HDV05_000628, partial [Chytridiales sp. JEL 0842]
MLNNGQLISNGFWDVFVQRTSLPGGLQGTIKPVVNDSSFIRLIKSYKTERGGKVVEFETLDTCGLSTVQVVTIKTSEDLFKSVNKRVLRFDRKELERCSVESAPKAE